LTGLFPFSDSTVMTRASGPCSREFPNFFA
jgi:hypothetical protein